MNGASGRSPRLRKIEPGTSLSCGIRAKSRYLSRVHVRRRKNATDVTQNIKFLTSLDSLISYMCSYTWRGFFERRSQAQILPKSGEKSRHQLVFFYARAEAENLGRRKPSRYTSRQIYCTSYQLFCGERGKHNAFPQNSFLARADFRKESFSRARYQGVQLARAAKSPRVGKRV